MGRTIRSLPLAGALGFGLGLAGAQGVDDPKEVELTLDRTPERCLSLSRINRTVVVDDQTILFYLRGRDDAYQNILPMRCPGLAANDRFMYSPFSNRLCDSDTITVLERFGSRFERGITCRLGEFYPLSELEAEDLVRANDETERGGGARVEVERVELPDDADNDEVEDGAETD